MPRRRSRQSKRIIIIAGPNGAGKTTFAKEFLPNEASVLHFSNADLISHGLSPVAPEKAAIIGGKIMLSQIAAHFRAGKSFAFETTLSGRSHVRHIRKWREAGYPVKLIFLSLPSAELAIRRVRRRVQQGGHDVPKKVIRRRFEAGKRNFDAFYKNLVDAWMQYDASGTKLVLLDSGENP
jgi:predicted ABC-type ATPase